jgi:SNF2 family DNA or RNA helicase
MAVLVQILMRLQALGVLPEALHLLPRNDLSSECLAGIIATIELIPDVDALKISVGPAHDTPMDNAGHKALIFSTMTQILDSIGEVLDWAGFLYERLDGNTNVSERHEVVSRFNTDAKVLQTAVHADPLLQSSACAWWTSSHLASLASHFMSITW